MSEVADTAAPSAGRLLREARERQGLHIAVLAASIKVTSKKLELLEADCFDALPDATFTRALAQTVCARSRSIRRRSCAAAAAGADIGSSRSAKA
jgi:cytoskeleton protein RodZ